MIDVRYERSGVEANSFGKYRLIAGLGRGGMATVHLAVVQGPAGFKKLVVLKQIHPEYTEDPEILGMFLDEAQLAARLSHPNVVQTNEIGQEGERHFMAMEYLEGQPLNRITRRFARLGGLPLVLQLRVIADLLNGLHYAHELTDYNGAPLGVVHRDVTPQNVFVTYDGAVKIVDFGIAKAKNALVQTRIGIIKGKIAYMAPEQARAEEVDRRVDIFAVGVMLWEAATGARPWAGVPELAIMRRLLAGDFPEPRAIRPDISPVLEAIIRKATAHDREDRHATAAELQAEIEGYIASNGERLQQRELGVLIAHHFSDERAKLKAVIEEQLRTIPTVATALPTIVDEATASSDEEAVSGNRPPPSTDSTGAAMSTVRVARPVSAPPQVGVTSGRLRPTIGGVAKLGALVVAVVFLAGGLSFRGGPSKVEAADAAPAPAVERPSSPPPAEIPSTVKLHVWASPPEARISLDDRPLDGNPWKGELPRDSISHRVLIDAPGFVGRTEVISLEDDRSLTITLRADPTALTALTATGAKLSPIRARPRGGSRPLDTLNPYAP